MRKLPRWTKVLVFVGLLAAAGAALAFVPTGQVAYVPTPPIDLDGKITVDGQQLEPLQGELSFVGVTERPVRLLQRLLLDLTDPTIDFAKEPPHPADGGPSKEDVAAMADAKQVAAGVALDLVEPGSVDWSGNGAAVVRIDPDSPASGVLRAGDIITTVDGASVDSSVDVSHLVTKAAPGTRLRLGFVRAGRPMRGTVRTVAPEEGDLVNRSRIGVALTTPGLDVELPRAVGVDSGSVVGPSAGAAFALSIYDGLADGDLLRGRHVVASGAIGPDGAVLPVGRMRQKAISVQEANQDLMLVPLANADEARAAIREACESNAGCVQVVPVRSVAEAIRLLELPDTELAARIAS